MASSLGEPFSLATYPYTYTYSAQRSKARNAVYEGVTYASHCPGSSSSNQDGLVTSAIQGDGVHVLNLTDMHPVSSHNLGPSTLFATNPVTVLCDEDGQTFRRTYAVMRRATGVKAAEEERTVWLWKEKATENLAVSQEKTTMAIPIEASELLTSDSIPSSLVFASRQAKIVRTDLQCNVINEWAPAEDAILDKSMLISRRDCNFMEAGSISGGAVLVLIQTIKECVYLQMLSLGRDGEMNVHAPLKILTNLKKNINVVDVTCDASGYLSILTSDYAWNTFRLEYTDGNHKLVPSVGALHLRGFKPLPTRKLKGKHVIRSASLLSLGSSFVLLAGETDSDSPGIALLLWDIQYGVLLHQQTMQLPWKGEADGPNNAPFVPLQLAPATSSQALLIISPPYSQKTVGSSDMRHSIVVVPYSVPATSTIASAFGKALSGSHWLVPDKPRREPNSKAEAMLQAVQDAVEEEKPEEADTAFFAWTALETSRWRYKGKKPQNPNEIGGPDISGTFTHSVTTRLFQSILPADAKLKKPYSPKIIRYLLENEIASDSMVTGGILPALCVRSDWESIRMCLSHVADIPELDLVRTLHANMKSQLSPSEDAMVVDNSSGSAETSIPLPSFLAGVVTYPCSPAPLRTALRTVFTGGEGLTTLLCILVDWLDEIAQKDIDLRPSGVYERGQGNSAPQPLKQTNLSTTFKTPPPVENIVSFLLALLDSSFLTLLQHSPSHPLLRRVFKDQIGSQIAFNNDLELLRGVLQPFAKTHAASVAEARSGRAGGAKKPVEQEDWRRRRRRIHEQNEMVLGPYQVEELVF